MGRFLKRNPTIEETAKWRVSISKLRCSFENNHWAFGLLGGLLELLVSYEEITQLEDDSEFVFNLVLKNNWLEIIRFFYDNNIINKSIEIEEIKKYVNIDTIDDLLYVGLLKKYKETVKLTSFGERIFNTLNMVDVAKEV